MALTPFQTDYNSAMAPGYAGMVANMEKSNIVSRSVEDEDGLGFGVVALRGENDMGVTGAGGDGAFLGISVADTTQLQDSYPQYATAAIITKGVVWVNAGAAVNAGDAVYFAGDGTLSSTDTGTEIPGASWDSSTTAAGLAKIRLG